MGNGLPTFHDADDGCLGLEVPVGGDTLMGLFVLFFGLFGLDLVDLDAIFGVGKVHVDREGIGGVDVSAFRSFAEDAVGGAC